MIAAGLSLKRWHVREVKKILWIYLRLHLHQIWRCISHWKAPCGTAAIAINTYGESFTLDLYGTWSRAWLNFLVAAVRITLQLPLLPLRDMAAVQHICYSCVSAKNIQLLSDLNLDFLFLTETWLKRTTSASSPMVPGYRCFRRDRSDGRRGGVLFLEKTILSVDIWI